MRAGARARFAGAHTIADFTRTWARLHRCAGFATLAEAAYMAAEKVSQTRTASLLSFLVSPRLTVALRGSPPSGSSLESFSLELLVLRGARNKRIRYEFASPPLRPRSFFRALSLSRLEPVGLARTVIPNALGSTRNLRIFAKEKTNCIVTLWLRSYSQQ